MFDMKLQCPYCLQAISIGLDLGVYEFVTLIEDCEVCCRPIELSYDVQNGQVVSFSYDKIPGNEF